jgi:transglutaminase-like putative cysteine protease
MRFAVAHKTATYLMVGFAYLAMTTGGALSPMLSFAGLMAMVGSWWWEPPRIRFEKWQTAWTIASVFALVYAVLTAIVTGDYLGVGGQFLLYLIVAKSFNRRAARDWQQMYLLSFLMLVAGSVLNPDLAYGLCFLGFVISSTWALTLFHLRREMEDNLLVKHGSDGGSHRVEVRRILDSRRIVGGRFFLGTGLLSFGVFLAAAAVFLALPRVGIGFFLKSRGGLTLAGFSDGVKLGGHGVIKNDSTVVMRVEIDKRYGGREAPEIHWRGVAFDLYSNGKWTRTVSAPKTTETTQLDYGRVTDRRYWWEGGKFTTSDQLDKLAAKSVKQEVILDPLDSDVLFGASRPTIFEYPHVLRPRKAVAAFNDEMRLDHNDKIRYTAYSDLTKPDPAVLRAASGPMPRNFGVYLYLGPEITQRTHALARRITAGLSNNYDKAVAIETWLENNATYTLVLADPGDQEAVDFFLFDRKKGHCEFFASAFAVLARAAGIPTRNVNGFLGGEWNEYQSYVAVRAGDAHSWDEVYFPGTGWVTFDPTPPADIDVLGRGGDGWRAKLGRFVDSLRFQWNKWVIEYDLASQLALLKSIGRAIKAAALAVKGAIITAKDEVVEHWRYPLPLLLPIGGLIGGRVRRRTAGDPLATARVRNRNRSTVAEVYLSVAKSLAKAGLARDAGTTPRELATRMTERGEPAAAEVGELTELYYAAEWGGRRDPAAEDKAMQLSREIRAALTAAKKSR